MNSANPDCVMCLENNLLKTEILAQNAGGFLIPALGRPGRYLLVPKKHAETIADLDDTWWLTVKKLFPSVPNVGEHFNLSLNVGKHAGQTIPHLHFWVVPRPGDTPSAGKGLVTLIEAADQAAPHPNKVT